MDHLHSTRGSSELCQGDILLHEAASRQFDGQCHCLQLYALSTRWEKPESNQL